MRVVILLDRHFARREHEMLSRLEIGLADEGVRVIHAVPFSALSEESVGLYSTMVGYQDRGFAFTRRFRAIQLRDFIRRTIQEDEDRGVDVVHAFGVPVWGLAMDLAAQFGSCLLLELWQAAGIGPAASLASTKVGAGLGLGIGMGAGNGGARGGERGGGGWGGGGRAPEFAVCEPALRRALRKRASHANVHLVPWGVHTPRERPRPRMMTDGPGPLSIAMLTDTGDPGAVTAALGGIARLADRPGGVMIFAGTQDGAAARDSAIWTAARRLGLLDRLSLVADMEARREPILQMDLLVFPEATGRQRTLALEAMTHGVPIIAAADELNESLVDGRTASLVRQPSADAWADALKDTVENPAATRGRLDAAFEFVRTQKSASVHVASVLTAYNAMVAAAKVGIPDLARSLS